MYEDAIVNQHVKIKIIKRMVNEDIVEKYAPGTTACPLFNEGDEYIWAPGERTPEGFCEWAWSDILKDILLVVGKMATVEKGEKQQISAQIASCSDGLRPVIFEITAIDD